MLRPALQPDSYLDGRKSCTHLDDQRLANQGGEGFFMLVAVHVGAGFHSLKNYPIYKEACDLACEEAFSQIYHGGDVAIACMSAIKVLEVYVEY